jgi:uncharacterized protein (TIRG00374 family)
MQHFRKILPFAISLILVGVLVAYAPWHEIGDILGDFDPGTILLLIGLSLLYYGLKALRFWYLLIAMEIQQPLKLVALSYISSQPASLLPGGEAFRSYALEKYTGVPVRRSIAQFTLQGILEGAGLATVMLGSAIALHALRIPAIILTVVVIVCLIGLARGYLGVVLHWLNRLPKISINAERIEHFDKHQRAVLSRKWLPLMYAMSLIIELVGAAIAYVSVVGLGGELNIYQAGLLYVIPIIVGFISLLPGGIGLSEQSAVGVLLLSKVSTAQAVAATLIMRVTIVGLGVLYGVIALLIGHRRLQKML